VLQHKLVHRLLPEGCRRQLIQRQTTALQRLKGRIREQRVELLRPDLEANKTFVLAPKAFPKIPLRLRANWPVRYSTPSRRSQLRAGVRGRR